MKSEKKEVMEASMEKNQKEEIDFNQKITSQGRRKWRRITRRQQEWLLKQ